jgi:hypothetical protein
VAHACNPSYSGGRGQEDRTSKTAQANSLGDPILRTPITKKKKKGWWSGSSQARVLQKKKERKEIFLRLGDGGPHL